MREPPPAVRDVPAIQSASVRGDHEACRAEAVCLEHRKRVVAQCTVRIVERDGDLVRSERPPAAHARRDLIEREGSPAVSREPLDLTRKSPRRDTRDAQLEPPVDLVVTKNP